MLHNKSVEEIQNVFATPIEDDENKKAVSRFRKALLAELDYYRKCLQIMSFDDDHENVEGDCPQSLIYARQQISELDPVLFWPAVRQMTPFLKGAVDLDKAIDMHEIQVLVEAGLWIKGK